MESTLATSLGTVITALQTGVTEIAPKVALAVVAGVGLGLIGFGMNLVVSWFKRAAQQTSSGEWRMASAHLRACVAPLPRAQWSACRTSRPRTRQGSLSPQ